MSTNPNDPTTWNKPGWESNSCYANSSLWALLYNDVFFNLIETTDTQIADKELNFNKLSPPKIIDKDTVNNNRLLIKTNLINFHNSIHNESSITPQYFYNYTRDIRQDLTNISSKDWTKNTDDPQQFLYAISAQFNDINNCDMSYSHTQEKNISRQFLPIIGLGLNSKIENSQEKKITITNGANDTTNCTFSSNTNGLIIQYGDKGTIIKDKFYSIGKYKLYAFLHYINEGHYACYFEFNNNWYIFDDFKNDSQGLIENIDMSKIDSKILNNDSFLFFYKIDDKLKFGDNILCSTQFNKKTPTPVQSKPLVQQSVKKDWLKMFNECNSAAKVTGGTRKKCKRKKNNKCRRTRKGRKTRKIIRGKNKKTIKK
jgi:hypothetical protein